jgi:pimeloyl-ACP methyl ester carboxylesterase
MPSRTFVLVHGAWHGGWCWRRVADLLTARGHRVFTPTMTGLGERSHLFDSQIKLSTHITDIVNLIKWEDLREIVLCGHSYGGFVTSGVAEQMPKAITSIVFLDAFVPAAGEALVELTRPATRDLIRAAVQRGEAGVPPPAAAYFNVNEKDRAWVDAMCTPHPVATMLDKITLTGAVDRIANKAYVRAGNYPNSGFDAALAKAKANPEWRTYEVPCGHDVMVDMPERLAEILEEVA